MQPTQKVASTIWTNKKEEGDEMGKASLSGCSIDFVMITDRDGESPFREMSVRVSRCIGNVYRL